MQNYSGFRIEIAKTSPLGLRLSTLSKYLRNRSDAKNVVRNRVRCYTKRYGLVSGTWTVRSTGSISFSGVTDRGLLIEYAFGKLTITEQSLVVVHKQKAVRMMSFFIQSMFPSMPSNVALDLSINVA